MDGQSATSDQYAAQASPSRRRLLALVREGGAAGQDAHQLAARTGLHVSTVRFHLQILERSGLVRSGPQPRGRSGRPRTFYTPTHRTDPGSGPSPYEQVAGLLAAHLDETKAGRTARAEQAGAAWAAQLTPAARPEGESATSLEAAARHVSDVFAVIGFDPELTTTGERRQIALRACPFRAVAREHPEVVCAMHRGLLRGVLARLGAPPTVTELLPFVGPELCVAHLAPAG